MDDQHQKIFYQNTHRKLPPYSINAPLYKSAMYKQEILSTQSIYTILAKQKTIENFHDCLRSHIEELGFPLFQMCYLEREKYNKNAAGDWPKHTWQALATSAPTLSIHPPREEDYFRISSVKSAVTQMDIDTSETYTGELIDDFDWIIVLNKGSVVGQGKHEELMKNCQLYGEMLELEDQISAGSDTNRKT